MAVTVYVPCCRTCAYASIASVHDLTGKFMREEYHCVLPGKYPPAGNSACTMWEMGVVRGD